MSLHDRHDRRVIIIELSYVLWIIRKLDKIFRHWAASRIGLWSLDEENRDYDFCSHVGFLPGSTSQSTLEGKKFQVEDVSHVYRQWRSGKQRWLEFSDLTTVEDGATLRKNFRYLHRRPLKWIHADICRVEEKVKHFQSSQRAGKMFDFHLARLVRPWWSIRAISRELQKITL